ncbi:MAG TPA: hypothetical protein VGJ09_13820, partial [Bryobacteraceae bacterium]
FAILLALIILPAVAQAPRAMSTAEVLAFVRSQAKLGDDRATADYLLHKIKLTEKLDDRTVEELQGQGAGPQTVRALRKLVDDSAALPAPPPVVVVAPPPQAPPPSAAEQKAILAQIREYALNYTANLPNYTCIQTTRRKIDPNPQAAAKGYRFTASEVQEMLTFFDKKETYQVQMVDGKAVKNIEHNQLGGTISNGEFGSMLSHVFDPAIDAQFEWDHWATLDGNKNMYVFGYHIPASEGYSMLDGESRREYTSAYKGLVYADHTTKTIQRITLETVEVPADFPIQKVQIKLDYRLTSISDQQYILPSHYLLTSLTDKASTENQAEYKLYRKYGAQSSITFDDTAPAPETPPKAAPKR